jgi:hypothetical protein
MHATVWQIKEKTAIQIDELITKSPYNKTDGICNEFIRKYNNHNAGLIIYGDPSGNNEDTRTEKGTNDYTIILKLLKDYKPSLRVPKAHPSPKMRGMFINTVFEQGYKDVNIIIGENCIKSIEDLQFIKENSDGGKLKDKVKDLNSGVTYEKYGHLSDSMDYFITEAFKSEYLAYQTKDRNYNYTFGHTKISEFDN